jgi:hypothetical protein
LHAATIEDVTEMPIHQPTTNMSITREQVDEYCDVIDNKNPELLCILELLRQPNDIPIVPNMRRRGDNVYIVNGEHEEEFQLNLQRFGIHDGSFVFPKKDGTVYSDSTFRPKINKLLSEAFPGATIRTIRKLYAPPAPSTARVVEVDIEHYIVQPQDLVPVSLDDIGLDEDVKVILQYYDVYTTVKDQEGGAFYPFVVIEFPNGTLLAYSVYKVVAGLPYYTRISPGYKLPTVDHTGRNTHDNRRVSLRYCTMSQNYWNKCGT